MGIKVEPFGEANGRKIEAYTLSNASDTSVTILTLGGTIAKLLTKDRAGSFADIVTGYDTAQEYLRASGFSGALIGRVANRLGGARFQLDGTEYKLIPNDGAHQLHGGASGFHFRIWDAAAEDGDEPRLTLSRLSPDGEENYPGSLAVTVTYTLTRDGAIAISYRATTDKITVVSMTSHAYFNLSGYASGTVDHNILTVDADKILLTDRDLIPTGGIVDVGGTDYDFRQPREVGVGFTSDDAMLRFLGGYDNCYLVNGSDGTLRRVAELYDPHSGRVVTVSSDQPCIQIYTSNMIIEDDVPFKGGVRQYRHCAVCLETEKMPDSPNHEGFTDITLRPGEAYTHNTVYSFGVR